MAIVVGAEKLSHPDKALSFAAFQSGYDQEEPPTAAAAEGAGAGRSVFMQFPVALLMLSIRSRIRCG